MRYITGDLTKDVESGTIIQQVNCMGGYGAGLSGALSRRWRCVEAEYRKLVAEYSDDRKSLLGRIQEVDVYGDGSLIVANSFSEYEFGNSYKTGKCYTHMDLLVNAIDSMCIKEARRGGCVYIPNKIGCALAGGKWDELEPQIEHNDNLVVVCLP